MEQLILTLYIKCKLVLTIATKLMVTPQKQQKLFIHMAVDTQDAMIGVTTILTFNTYSLTNNYIHVYACSHKEIEPACCG